MRGQFANTLSSLSGRGHDWARGWLILVLVAVLVAFAAVTLPGAEKASGGRALDAEFFYTPEMAFSTVASYSDAGRAWIRNYYLTGDIVNPILYSLILGLFISWLFQRGFKRRAKVQILNVIPVGAALFDGLENICIATILSVYPAQPKVVAWLSTGCTMTKSIFLYASFLIVLVGLAKAAMSRFRKQP